MGQGRRWYTRNLHGTYKVSLSRDAIDELERRAGEMGLAPLDLLEHLILGGHVAELGEELQ